MFVVCNDVLFRSAVAVDGGTGNHRICDVVDRHFCCNILPCNGSLMVLMYSMGFIVSPAGKEL